MERANGEDHFVNLHRDVFLPAIDLDRGSSVPLHRQIAMQIERAIANGTRSGSRLPSTRVMARLLGVSAIRC